MDQGFNLPIGTPELPEVDFPRETLAQPDDQRQTVAIDPRLLEDEGRLLGMLTRDLARDLEFAIAAKGDLDKRIERYRMYFSMDRDPPAYDGAPNHRVPYVRAKVMGATAHFRNALDQDPFFVARPYTADGSKHRGPWETMMERELDRSQTRRQIWHSLLEGGLTGTGVMQLSVSKPGNEFIVNGRAVSLEDFYVIPPGTEDVARVSTFLRFWEPWHVIALRGDAGEYDQELIETKLRPGASSAKGYHERKDGTASYTDKSENTPYELYECYYRWHAEGIGSRLWRVIYSKERNIIISAMENPYARAFDAPPYTPMRVLPRIGYFYGESYSQVLEGIQHVMDWSYNSLIAYDQFALTPPTFVDMDSEAYALLKDTGLQPGMLVPVRGSPKDSVYSTPLPPAREPYQLLMALRSLGEDATFSDLQLNGLPTSTVRSATEISAITSAAQKKLAEDLSAVSHDLSVFARMYWALIYEYKIRPKGVVPVYKGSDQYLIAARDIEEDELMGHLRTFMGSQGMPVPGDEVGMPGVQAGLDQGGVELFIASGRRDDIEWLPNGAKLVSDRMMHANKMERLISGVLPVLSFARQDRSAWHIVKEYLIALDLHNWEDMIPPEPPEEFASPEAMQQFTEQMNAIRQGGGVG